MSKTLLLILNAIWIICLVSCGGGNVESISNSDPSKVRSSPRVSISETDWPWWSGPSRDFSSTFKSIPVVFGENLNCEWKYAIRGEGHASPIVVGDSVFLAEADPSAKTKSLTCLDRKTGKQKWSTKLHEGSFMHTHGKNSQASATPASDGKLVFTAFMFDSGIQVSAVDFKGKIVWQKKAGGFKSRHGYGSSPVLYRSLVIIAGDNPGSGFLTALNRETGEIVWRINRSNESSYSTPSVVTLSGKDQLLISGAGKVHGYDPATGQELWSSAGPATTTANTVVTDGELVFAGGGYPQKGMFCIDPKSSDVKWKVENVKSYVPSPLLVGDSVIIPDDKGILYSLDKQTGEENWKVRLGQDVSGSGVVVGQRLYIGGERGTLFVIDLEKSGKMVAKNKLDSRIMSTPAICNNRILVRTSQSLFCFANPTIENNN